MVVLIISMYRYDTSQAYSQYFATRTRGAGHTCGMAAVLTHWVACGPLTLAETRQPWSLRRGLCAARSLNIGKIKSASHQVTCKTALPLPAQ